MPNTEAGLDALTQRPVRYEVRLKGSFKESEDTMDQTVKTSHDSYGVLQWEDYPSKFVFGSVVQLAASQSVFPTKLLETPSGIVREGSTRSRDAEIWDILCIAPLRQLAFSAMLLSAAVGCRLQHAHEADVTQSDSRRQPYRKDEIDFDK